MMRCRIHNFDSNEFSVFQVVPPKMDNPILPSPSGHESRVPLLQLVIHHHFDATTPDGEISFE